MSKNRLLSTVRVCVFSAVLAMLSPLATNAQYDISDEDAIAAAKKFANHVVNGRFEKAVKYLGDEGKKDSAKELKEMFEKEAKDVGKFESFEEATAETLGDRKLVKIPTHFEHGFLTLSILVNYQGEIVGIKYQGVGIAGKEGEEKEKPEKEKQVKAKPEKEKPKAEEERFGTSTKDVTFGKKPWEVKGKLTLPETEKSVPVVLLVQGSGAHDEDGTVGPNKPFADLAVGLASQGVAVLRYSNRAFAHGDKLKEKKDVSVREEMIDDVLEALKFLRKQKEVDKSRIYLLGLGFAGSLTAKVAQEDKHIAGVIVMASSPRNIADTIENQLKYVASIFGPQQAATKKALEASSDMFAKLRDGSAPADGELLGQSISRWKDMNEYSTKSAETLAELDCRILIAGAGRDYQITRDDFDVFKKALKGKSNVKFKWYKEMNHYFVRGEVKSTPYEYKEEAPVDLVVIGQLAKWVRSDEGGDE
ncbi:MAG TPA: DUF3887 domain-containing protein [Phycisphaerae bacterium]|nr:DUF3887 domain-containing protein [Phycisphaerae bacterium]